MTGRSYGLFRVQKVHLFGVEPGWTCEKRRSFSSSDDIWCIWWPRLQGTLLLSDRYHNRLELATSNLFLSFFFTYFPQSSTTCIKAACETEWVKFRCEYYTSGLTHVAIDLSTFLFSMVPLVCFPSFRYFSYAQAFDFVDCYSFLRLGSIRCSFCPGMYASSSV